MEIFLLIISLGCRMVRPELNNGTGWVTTLYLLSALLMSTVYGNIHTQHNYSFFHFHQHKTHIYIPHKYRNVSCNICREQFIIYKCEILQSSLVLLNIPTIMRKVLLYWVRGFLESSATRIYLLRMYEIILRCTHGRILPLCKRKTFVGGFIIILPLNTFRSSWCK